MSLSQMSLDHFKLPRHKFRAQKGAIAAPSYECFTTRFGGAFPEPCYLESDLGTTTFYDLPPPSGESKRQVLIIHGLNTPALGMLPLAKELQAVDRDAHIVLYDLWGHGLSSTPCVAHTPHVFHFQILQVLGHMQWSAAHILGYSFGGSTAVRFAIHNPNTTLSVALLAPAGLLPFEGFSEQLQELLKGPEGKEEETIENVFDFLEGGPLVVPEDWKKKSEAGEVVAEALRQWELHEHAGYKLSVLSMFQDGDVYGCEHDFAKFAQLAVKQIGIVAEEDPVSGVKQLVECGFKNVDEVMKAGHGFVRSHADEVARIILKFWKY